MTEAQRLRRRRESTDVPCTWCGVGVDQVCRQPNGAEAILPHQARFVASVAAEHERNRSK